MTTESINNDAVIPTEFSTRAAMATNEISDKITKVHWAAAPVMIAGALLQASTAYHIGKTGQWGASMIPVMQFMRLFAWFLLWQIVGMAVLIGLTILSLALFMDTNSATILIFMLVLICLAYAYFCWARPYLMAYNMGLADEASAKWPQRPGDKTKLFVTFILSSIVMSSIIGGLSA